MIGAGRMFERQKKTGAGDLYGLSPGRDLQISERAFGIWEGCRGAVRGCGILQRSEKAHC